MKYIEIIARVAPGDVERACDALRDATGAGVWAETPFSQRFLDEDAETDDSADVRVHAYIAAERANGVIDDARLALTQCGVDATVECRSVDEEDWAEAWKEHFHVERFGQRIVVVPSWREFAPGPDDVVITLDPGMAFGTGQHETTRMCLEALERTVDVGGRVLDVGCGSGILAIAAAKLGAREVVALDVDANCVRITAENATVNSVDDIVSTSKGSLGDAWPRNDVPAAGFDVVVANIIARVIVEMAPDLASALSADGTLIVSGIIGEREVEVSSALKATDLRVTQLRAMGEWRCIEAMRA